MGLIPVRADWRSVSTMPGDVSVIVSLMMKMLKWHVGSWEDSRTVVGHSSPTHTPESKILVLVSSQVYNYMIVHVHVRGYVHIYFHE